MKDQTLGGIIIGSYMALILSWCGLSLYNTIRNDLEDKTAVTKVDTFEGTVIKNSRRYVAFDKSSDGEIDEIKDYSVGMIGSRMPLALPYTLKYYKGDKKFEHIKQKYFSQYK